MKTTKSKIFFVRRHIRRHASGVCRVEIKTGSRRPPAESEGCFISLYSFLPDKRKWLKASTDNFDGARELRFAGMIIGVSAIYDTGGGRNVRG